MSSVRMSLSRQRRWPVIVIGVIVLLAILFTFMSTFYVDLLWFREVNYSSVFWTTLRTKAVLGLVFGLVFFALLYANLLIVRKLAPTTRPTTPEQEIVERIRQNFEPYLKWLLPLGSAVIAVLVAVGVTRQWQTFLLWRNSGGISFGHPDPLFNRDPAFYVFSLPWLRFVQGWLFSALVGVAFLAGIGHFLWGGIRPQAVRFSDKVDPPVRAHLSVLLGLIMLVKAWGYYLGRFDLLTSKRGVVEGASYTDVKAQLPALTFLAIVAIICAALFLANIRVRIWALPIIAVGLLAVVSVLLGTAYPAFVQRFKVAPQEFQREQPYIADNITATRDAFGLTQIQSTPSQDVASSVTAADLKANDPTITNIRLWRPSILLSDFQSLQRFRQYYEFRDVDVDRYPVNGQTRMLMVAGREITPAGIPSGGGTWQNQHLVYTHGYGAAAAQVNTATTEGAPQFTLQNVPPSGQPISPNWSIYYGPGGPDDAKFVIVNSGTPEFQYEGAPPVSYTGSGGIPMGNMLQRALFAWRFRDVNLLISGQIKSDSRIMIYRDLETRVRKAVPFLTFDKDPYLVVTNEGLKWIWDAYTTTTQYPYSDEVPLDTATDGDLSGNANYMRNSVKVEIDAYTGAITYYADETDPIIQVWTKAFPGLFTPRQDAPPDIQAHFRYPENLFQVQATEYANYHVTDPSVFYQKQDFWQIPNDPTLTAPTTSTSTDSPSASGSTVLRPYYLLMKIPGESTEHFELVLPFVPQGRQNMVAWMAANSDPVDYGKMVSFVFPPGVNIDGPDQVYSRINQDPDFSRDRTLLGTGGSQVLFGDFQVIPVEQSFLYVLPVYVRSAQTTAVPELKRVIVVNGSTVGVGTSLNQALDAAIAGQTGGGTTTGGGNPGGGTTDQQVADLLTQALQHFQQANQALTQGNLALYQSELKQAQSLVQQANNLASKAQGSTGSTGGTPTPPPTASTSPPVSASASP